MSLYIPVFLSFDINMDTESVAVKTTQGFIDAVNPSLIEDFGCELAYDDVGKVMVLNTIVQSDQQYSWTIANMFKSTPNIERASSSFMYESGLLAKYLTEILEKCRTFKRHMPIECCVSESQC